MSELSPASQLASRWRAKRPSSSISAAAPHRMSGSRRGSCLARPPARSTAATFSCTASAEPAQAVGVAAVRDRRGHLEQREVADDGAEQAPVKPEHRHEVDGCQRDGRNTVGVRAVAAVEAERVHRVGEQPRVDPPRIAAAVLVRLDLDQRRLRPAAEARQRPRVRVGLLELVRGPVDDELEELLERASSLEVLGQRRRLVGGLDLAQRQVHRPAAGWHRHVAPQVRLEARFELGAQREQRRLPLPARVDAGQAAVVQLVAEVQRQLVVLVAADRRRRGQRCDRACQRVEQELGDGAAGLGEGLHTASPTQGSRRPATPPDHAGRARRRPRAGAQPRRRRASPRRAARRAPRPDRAPGGARR
jgi:hypothetical protein